jgi:magnesium transporter
MNSKKSEISEALGLEQSAIYLLIGDYLDENNFEDIHPLIKDFHPADLAYLLQFLNNEDAIKLLRQFDSEHQANIVRELSGSTRQYIVENLEGQSLSHIVNEMESDDAADLVALLDKDTQEEVLEQAEEEDAQEVRELLQYKEDSAGRIMSKEVVSIIHNAEVEEAIAEIRKSVQETEQIYNVFVTSQESILLGILPLNTLVLAKPHTKVRDLMEEVRSVQTTVDQEQVARTAKKYDLLEIPVVDENQCLVGRITYDDILDVVEEEAEEDIRRLSGTGSEEVDDFSILHISRQRLTWLIIGLLGGVFAASIMSQFKTTLSEVVLFAFFVPVIMAMGGIVGIQSSTITVRGLAMGEIVPGQLTKRVLRELQITLLTGTVCSVLLGSLITWWAKSLPIALVVGGSMFAVMFMSTLSGTVIPMILNKFKIDPALATGPFVTTMNDVLGLATYFTIATYTLHS